MTPTGPRLAIVVSHPTQYYSPWFRWLANHTGLDLRVFYLWDFGVTKRRDVQFGTSFRWDVDLLSGYAHEFVPNTAPEPGSHRFGGLRNPTLTARLQAWRPSALLLFGYRWHSHLLALWWARRRGVPVLFRGDSHFLGRGAPPLPRRLLLRALYAQCSGFLAVGAANAEYFRVLGVPERRIFHAPHAVDAEWFDPGAAGHQAAARRLRADLGIAPDTSVVLFAGKLVPAKQPQELLAAFLAADIDRTALVFVGDGSCRAALQETAARSGNARVHFLPFANQSEMPARYLLADIFALPSRGHYETWGLAVNEAMHMGVPALVSDLVGCQRDLVTENATGWVFRATAPAALAETLRVALAEVGRPGRRAALRDAVRARIGGYTYAQTTTGLLSALDALPRPG